MSAPQPPQTPAPRDAAVDERGAGAPPARARRSFIFWLLDLIGKPA